MSKKFMCRNRSWSCGALVITGEGLETGGDRPLPPGFKDWEAVEAAIMNHSDFGGLVFEVPTSAQMEAARMEELQKMLGKNENLFRCRYCGNSFENAGALAIHEKNCDVMEDVQRELQEKMIADGWRPPAEINPAAVIPPPPLNTPDEEKEKADALEQSRIRAEQEEKERQEAEARKKANAEKRAKAKKK